MPLCHVTSHIGAQDHNVDIFGGHYSAYTWCHQAGEQRLCGEAKVSLGWVEPEVPVGPPQFPSIHQTLSTPRELVLGDVNMNSHWSKDMVFI